jgi:hypothetical protein
MASEKQTHQKQAQTTEAGDRSPLPFEPKRKKVEKPAAKAPAPRSSSSSNQVSAPAAARTATADIPEVVNRRMLKRMAFFCGVPTFLGVSTFFVSYFVITQGLFNLPHTAVLLVSLGFFGLGVVGLSYGALSSSWDEAEPGSLVGLSEFQTNLGRLTGAWREAGEQKRQGKKP